MLPTRFLRSTALLVVCLVWTPVAVSAADSLSQGQREEVINLVRELFKANPEIVVEALQVFQQKQEQLQAEAQKGALTAMKSELENDPSSPVAGNPDGDVTIVEFMDYRCGYCKRVFPDLVKLLEEDGNIRYVFKEFPVLGKESELAARAALAVWNIAPDKYFDFHKALMNNRGAITQSKLIDEADDLDIDEDDLTKAMADAKVDAALQKTFSIAKALDIRGTPAFIVGGHLVPGAIGLDALKELVALARKG